MEAGDTKPGLTIFFLHELVGLALQQRWRRQRSRRWVKRPMGRSSRQLIPQNVSASREEVASEELPCHLQG